MSPREFLSRCTTLHTFSSAFVGRPATQAAQQLRRVSFSEESKNRPFCHVYDNWALGYAMCVEIERTLKREDSSKRVEKIGTPKGLREGSLSRLKNVSVQYAQKALPE